MVLDFLHVRDEIGHFDHIITQILLVIHLLALSVATSMSEHSHQGPDYFWLNRIAISNCIGNPEVHKVQAV